MWISWPKFHIKFRNTETPPIFRKYSLTQVYFLTSQFYPNWYSETSQKGTQLNLQVSHKRVVKKNANNLRPGWPSVTSALTVSKCENIVFFSLKFDSLTLKHLTHFISLSRVSKMHFSCPLHLHYFRNIHPLWEWIVLFQKYPSTMRVACSISEISTHYEMSSSKRREWGFQ